ncbi:MAG: hypothetical protein ACETWT_13425 [Thermodesulfobacteriota bacterium]|jgi:hypothetical protein
MEQGTQKNQPIIAPRSQDSQKREENDGHKGDSTTENHPKRMITPYISFLLFHGYPHYYFADGHGLFQPPTISRAKGVPKERRTREIGEDITF